jgi:hypothetical protein
MIFTPGQYSVKDNENQCVPVVGNRKLGIMPITWKRWKGRKRNDLRHFSFRIIGYGKRICLEDVMFGLYHTFNGNRLSRRFQKI